MLLVYISSSAGTRDRDASAAEFHGSIQRVPR